MQRHLLIPVLALACALALAAPALAVDEPPAQAKTADQAKPEASAKKKQPDKPGEKKAQARAFKAEGVKGPINMTGAAGQTAPLEPKANP